MLLLPYFGEIKISRCRNFSLHGAFNEKNDNFMVIFDSDKNRK